MAQAQQDKAEQTLDQVVVAAWAVEQVLQDLKVNADAQTVDTKNHIKGESLATQKNVLNATPK